MHLYYNRHDKDDIAKLAELMTVEKQMREEGGSPTRSQSPETIGHKRQINFIFRTMNWVSGLVGLTFLVVGLSLFYKHYNLGVYFGSVGYTVMSFTLGLDGISLLLVAALGLLFSTQSKSQLFLYAVGGALLFCIMLSYSLLRLPEASGLLSNVSMEMSQSLLASKRGDKSERAKWDSLQSTYHCCGLRHYFEWCHARNLTQVHQDTYRKCHIPESCFSNDTYGMPAQIHTEHNPNTPVFESGCFAPKMQTLLMEMSLLKSFIYIMLIFLVFDVIFAAFIITGFLS